MTGSTEAGPMLAVHRFIEGFNSDDVERAQAACADTTSIIDDFPPYEWSGPDAATRWYRDMAAMATEAGMSDWSVRSEEPRHLMASDGRGYVVVPVEARWLEDATPAVRPGYFTAALLELAEEWRISAFAWAWT
jgi:hypothetical protein